MSRGLDRVLFVEEAGGFSPSATLSKRNTAFPIGVG